MSDPFNWRVIGNTLRVAAWVTLVCLVIGYPAAFALARAGAVRADRHAGRDHPAALDRRRGQGLRLADRAAPRRRRLARS